MTGFGVWLRGLFGKTAEVPDLAPSLERTKPAGPQSFAEDNNDFALAMFRRLGRPRENLFFSPFSIRTCLAMVHAGARDGTAAQMREALCISSSDEMLHTASAEVVQRLRAARSPDEEIAIASSLWGQDGVPLEPRFLDLIARHYDGAMNLVEFRRRAEAARATINEWVVDRTRKRIRDLIPPRGVDADTRLVLVNAVYFKGKWALRFRTEATRDESFHLEGGGKVRVPLMFQQERIPYLEAGDYQVVDLAYRGGNLSMLVLLPKRKDGVRDLESSLSAQILDDCVAQMRTCAIKLFLPRFKIRWGTVDLKDQLTALGMPLAFSRSQANFSGINGRVPPDPESLFISAVFHQAFVETNEEGTEAAAATAAAVMVTGARFRPSKPPPIPIVRADHPFVFAIRDRESGAILFLGRIADPTRES
jgi:serpin B